MGSFDMGNVEHHIKLIADLHILKCTQENKLENLKHKWGIQVYRNLKQIQKKFKYKYYLFII